MVYDYMPRRSIADLLHDRLPETHIDWATRMQIAKGVARGLLSLHNDYNMIHGNLTPNNVLLDENNNPKISDIRWSRLLTDAANSYMFAKARILGYQAPEFSSYKNIDTKTDIYSLGVIMLELLTGKSPGEEINGLDLKQWVDLTVKEEWTNEVFDHEIVKDVNDDDFYLIDSLIVALKCVATSPADRPDAGLVLRRLEEIRPETTISS